MTAAPHLRPEPSEDSPVRAVTSGDGGGPDSEADAQADAEGWALLDALRRKLDEQGNQGRKTASQVGQLADSIAALVSEQRKRSRWANMNSFVAYLIFTVVVGAAFFALYNSRARELVEARDVARKERDVAIARADAADAKAAERATIDATAWEIYQLLDAGKRKEAVAKLDAIPDGSLSRTERAVLAARAHETAVMEVEAALKAASVAFKAGRYPDVIAPLEAGLVNESTGPRAAEMHYYLGVAYAKGNDLDKAVTHLRAALDLGVDRDDTGFQLASALDRSGEYAKARAAYDQFATAHPQLGLAVYAMRRSATLARMPAVAPPGTSPADSGALLPPGGVQRTPAPKAVAPAPKAAPAPKTVPATPTPTAPAPAKSVLPAPRPATPPAAAPTGDAASAAPMSTLPLSLGSVADKDKPKQDKSGTTVERKREEPKNPTELPPQPRADASPVPAPPIERTPPRMEPPIERPPAPSPRTPPRGDHGPPPSERALANDPAVSAAVSVEPLAL